MSEIWFIFFGKLNFTDHILYKLSISTFILALHQLLGFVSGEMAKFTIAASVGDTISLSDLCQIK